jgi:hypothetical protein
MINPTTTRQFVALWAVRRDAEFPGDLIQDALASGRARAGSLRI